MTPANFWDLREMNEAFEDLGAYRSVSVNLTGFEYPERVAAVVAVGSYACAMRDPSQPWGATREQMEDFRKFLIANWGTGKDIGFWAPTPKNDQAYREWWVKLERYGASPGAVADFTALYPDIDVRHALPLIQAPMLVIHAKNDRAIPVQAARVLAEKVPNARLVEPSRSHSAGWCPTPHGWSGGADH